MRARGSGLRPSTILGLQNDVRRAVNHFPAGDNQHRQGVEPRMLKRFILSTVQPRHRSHITVRRHADDQSEYELRYRGELLFRLVYVPWPELWTGGRWHVRRHPRATWWR